MSGQYGPYSEEQGAFSADVRRALDFVLFAVRALRRRRRIASLAFVATVIASLLALSIMPKMYRVTTRVLTHRAYILPALVSPRRAIPLAADAPTKGATEMLKSRQLLEAVIAEASLKDSWDATRTGVGRVKDALRGVVLGPIAPEDFHEALLELLEQRLVVYIDDEVVVTQLEWHHPDVALAISEALRNQFLGMRKDGELSEVRETLRILEGNVESAHRTMEGASEEFQRVVASKAKGAGGAPIRMKTIRVRRPSLTSARGADDAAEKAEVQRDLAEIRRVSQQEEARYQKRLDEANAALSGLRTSLGPEHPDVQSAVRVVEERTRVAPELMQLRAQEAELERRLKKLEQRGSSSGDGGSEYDTVEVPETAVNEQGDGPLTTDPDIERAITTLEQRIARYNEFVLRLEDARTELATADAAFDHRYIVTQPPLYPKKHVKPKAPAVVGAGFVAALLLAFLFALGSDLASRRVLEPWQVERVVGLPVLGAITVQRPLLKGGETKDT